MTFLGHTASDLFLAWCSSNVICGEFPLSYIFLTFEDILLLLKYLPHSLQIYIFPEERPYVWFIMLILCLLKLLTNIRHSINFSNKWLQICQIFLLDCIIGITQGQGACSTKNKNLNTSIVLLSCLEVLCNCIPLILLAQEVKSNRCVFFY